MRFVRFYKLPSLYGDSRKYPFSKFSVHIPAEWAKEMQFKEGDVLQVTIEEEKMIVERKKDDD